MKGRCWILSSRYLYEICISGSDNSFYLGGSYDNKINFWEPITLIELFENKIGWYNHLQFKIINNICRNRAGIKIIPSSSFFVLPSPAVKTTINLGSVLFGDKSMKSVIQCYFGKFPIYSGGIKSIPKFIHIINDQ